RPGLTNPVECTMARIREALRPANTLRAQLQERVPAPRPYQPEEIPFNKSRTFETCHHNTQFRTEVEEEVPFIEVGGRETPTEASPSVLASVPKTARGNQHVEPTKPDSFGKPREMAAPAAEVRLGFSFSFSFLTA